MVNVLKSCLWNIGANLDTLDQATEKKGQAKVPSVWTNFCGYNDYKSMKYSYKLHLVFDFVVVLGGFAKKFCFQFITYLVIA